MSDPILDLFGKGEPDATTAATEKFRNANPPTAVPAIERRESFLGKAGRQAMNFAQVMADEAAFGLTRPVNTAIFGTIAAGQDLISGYKGATGDKGPLGVIGEAYGRVYDMTDSELDESVSEIGPVGQMMAAIGGNLSPMAPARIIDNAFDAGRSLENIVAPTATAAGSRFWNSAIAGGSSAALQGYFQGNTDIDDLVLNGAFGGMLGGTMQKLLGDQALPYITNFRNAEGAVINDLIDTGRASGQNLNLAAIARAVDSGEIGVNGALTARIGNAPNYRQWGKVNDAIAEYTFGGIDPRTLNTKQAADLEDQFIRVQKAVTDAAETVNVRAREEFRFALDNPAGRKETLYENSVRLRSAREIYARMSATDTPDSLGNVPFSPPDMMDAVNSRLLSMDKRTDVLQLSPESTRMRNAFKDLIRGREVESVALGLQNIPSKGVDDPRAPDIFPDELPMHRLLDARRTFSELLSPSMAFKSGMSRSELRAGKEILNAIDEQLNEITNDGFGLAKGAFAEAMKVEEAFDLGKRVYDQRHIEVDDQEAFGKYYGEYVSDMMDEFVNSESKEVSQAFSAGFKQGMFDQVGRRGFLPEMQNFIGPADAGGDGFFRGKGENFDLLRRIVGEEDTNTILRLYNDGKLQDQYMNLLRNNLNAVGMSPDSAMKLTGMQETRDAMFMPLENQSLVVRGVKSLYNRMLKPSDRRKADVALDLMLLNGDELRNLISRGATSAVGGAPVSVGTRSGAALNYSDVTGASSEDEGARQQQEAAAMEEYFKSIGIESGFE